MTRSPIPDPRRPHRVLIIRPSALGDVARTVPCLVSLRRAYPDATIDWLVASAFVDAVRAHPMLDGVVAFDRKDKKAFVPLLRRLRAAEYDLVFDLQGLARSGLLAWASRAPVRVGYANARELGWLGVNQRHDIDPTRHAADRMLALLEAAGVPRVEDYRLAVPPEDDGFAREYVNQTNTLRSDVLDRPSLSGRYVCLAPTAQWGCKCWPIERYADVATRLLAGDHAAAVVVVSAPHEYRRVRDAMSARVADEVEDRLWCPATTVGQMMSVIRDAALLVGNDSAPLHLAVGLDTPTVSLFGPTDPALVGPPPPPPEVNNPTSDAKHRVLRAPSAVGQTFNYRSHRDDDALISELSVDAVWDTVREQLATSGG